MNSAFLRFRLRQAGKFIREIPVIYLVILTGILLIAGIALYQFTKDLHGSLIIAGILLVFLSLIQLRRKDYHFIYLAEEKAWKVFSMDYFLLSLPVLIIISVNLFWYVSLAIIAGCISLGFIKQPFHRTKKGMNSPKWIPAEAFELRSGIRQYGGLLLILYVSAWIGFFGIALVLHSHSIRYIQIFRTSTDTLLTGASGQQVPARKASFKFEVILICNNSCLRNIYTFISGALVVHPHLSGCGFPEHNTV